MISNLIRRIILQYQSRIFYESFRKCIFDAGYSASEVLDVCGGDGSFGTLCMDGLSISATTFDLNASSSNSSVQSPILVGDVLSYDFKLLGNCFDVVTLNNSWQLFRDHHWFENLLSNLRPKYVFLTIPADETLAALRSVGYRDNFEGSHFSNAVSHLQNSGYKLINSGRCGRSNFVTTRWLFIMHIIMYEFFGLFTSKGNIYRYGFFELDTL